jgi:hypothetical protein
MIYLALWLGAKAALLSVDCTVFRRVIECVRRIEEGWGKGSWEGTRKRRREKYVRIRSNKALIVIANVIKQKKKRKKNFMVMPNGNNVTENP